MHSTIVGAGLTWIEPLKPTVGVEPPTSDRNTFVHARPVRPLDIALLPLEVGKVATDRVLLPTKEESRAPLDKALTPSTLTQGVCLK